MLASGSRGLTLKSKSTTVPQLSQLITSQWCFETSAAAIFGQNHTLPLAESVALKRRNRMGPIAFSAQYQQSPIPPGGTIIKRK